MKRKFIVIGIVITVFLILTIVGIYCLKNKETSTISIDEDIIVETENDLLNVELDDDIEEVNIVEENIEQENTNINESSTENEEKAVNINTTKSSTSKSSTQNTNVSTSSVNTKTNNSTNETTKSSTETSNNEVTVKDETTTSNENTTEVKKEEDVVETPTRCTTNDNHGMGVGNSGQWFSSKEEAIAYYDNKIKYWGNLWETEQIDNETYYTNCPYGYEMWTCMYCSKWTINFYYR